MSRDRIRVAAYALCRDEHGRILLCHIAPSVGAGDLWTLPGGGLEFGEPPIRAVVRELHEETGYLGEVVTLVDISDRLFTDIVEEGVTVRMHAIRIVYEVSITGGELRDEPDGSTDTCRWLALDAAAGLRLGELARQTIDRLREPVARHAQ